MPQTLARYRARVRRHRTCGIRTDGRVPGQCVRCDVVDEYRNRRELYLDERERSDAQNERETPVLPKVTFRWWLEQHPYPPTEEQYP